MNAALQQLATNVTTIHGAVAGQHRHLESTAGMVIQQADAVGRFQRITDELSCKLENTSREVQQVIHAMESVQQQQERWQQDLLTRLMKLEQRASEAPMDVD